MKYSGFIVDLLPTLLLIAGALVLLRRSRSLPLVLMLIGPCVHVLVIALTIGRDSWFISPLRQAFGEGFLAHAQVYGGIISGFCLSVGFFLYAIRQKGHT